MATPLPAPPIRRASLAYPSRRLSRQRTPVPWRWPARRRRVLLIAMVAAQSIVAAYYMLAVLPYHGATMLEIALTVAFTASFGWVSIGAWLAVFGFVMRCRGGDPLGLLARSGPRGVARVALTSRTAVIMPIYNEAADRALSGLGAVYRSLERTGKAKHFDFFVLSDSRDSDVWLAEQAAWYELAQKLDAQGQFFYRRRRINLRHKSGNVADFLRRWGRNYDYFVVLDADSLMAGRTLIRMVRLMQQHPEVGILQAPPRIVGARSLFARLQQFSNRLYGPLFTAGLAALQLGDGSYWGHNAIIRTHAFMRHCGLSSLRGVGLFRGPILSHDFVEAAYMRRAGYEVWLEPRLGGSYEESPPTLVDELGRDRRWTKGNLQHLALMLGGRGLALAHRFTFLNGVAAYAAGPLWLTFLALSAAELAQFILWPINYFPGGHRLFPVWPEWHPDWAIRLAASTAFVLLLPKTLAFLDVVADARLRRGFGGAGRLAASILVESLASVFLAPVRMLAHSRFVAEAIVNLRVHWAGQNRGGEIGWGAALAMHGAGMILGIAWGAFAWWLRPLFFYWSLPVALPLALAPVVSVLTSRFAAGDAFARRGILLTPEDRNLPRVSRLLRALAPDRPGYVGPVNALARAVLDPQWHAAAIACSRRAGRAQDSLVQSALEKGPRWPSKAERNRLADDAVALGRLRHAVLEGWPVPWRTALNTMARQRT